MALLKGSPIELFDRMCQINARGVVVMSKLVLPSMREQKRGVTTNNSSTTGVYQHPLMTHYCASNHAVVGLTKAMANVGGC